MLEYDNSAFYYFAITLLIIYVLPGTWYAVAEFFRAFFGSGEVGSKARTKEEKEKASKLKKQTTGWTRLNTTPYLANLGFLVFAWIILIYLMSLVSNDGEVSSFDPYTILGIEQGSALGVIKKAYRALSLKYHPDKNQGDRGAEEMFMKVAKAYEALTDETSKENYEKYGNPDGKQSLEVSIGLPKILLDNPKVVLVLYLIAMVVIIPSAVGWWYSHSKQFGEKNILYETYNTFYSLLQETHRVKNLPEILAASAEFRAINVPQLTDNSNNKTEKSAASERSEAEVMDLLYEKCKKEKLMIKPKYEVPKVLRGNLLLHAHLIGDSCRSLLTPALTKDLQAMLRRGPELLEGLIEIAQHRKWLETSLAAIKLSQYLIQGLWTTADPFAQLPYLAATNEADLKKLKALLPKECTNKTFRDFLHLTKEEKKRFLSVALTASGSSGNASEQCEELLTLTEDIFPRISIETCLFVEEEDENFHDDDEEPEDDKKKVEAEKKAETADKKEGEEGAVVTTDAQPAAPVSIKGDDIFEQDLVTLRITITRDNLPPVITPSNKKQLADTNKGDKKKKNSKDTSLSKSSMKLPPVYAPHFPATIYESWWIVLTDKPKGGSNSSLVAGNKPPGGGGAGGSEVNIHAFEKVTYENQKSRQIVHEIRFMAPPKIGHYEMELSIYSDCYLGLDEVRTIAFDVRPAAELPEYVPHQEDVDLDNDPTLFEQLAANTVEESSDEEDEDEEEEESSSATKALADKKKKDAAAAASNKKNSGDNNNGQKKRTVVVEDVEDNE